MAQKTNLSLLYETLLTVPGMNEPVKIDLRLPRKDVFILSKVIEQGLQRNGEEIGGIIISDIASQETLEELNGLPEQLLQKADLLAMNEKLAAFAK